MGIYQKYSVHLHRALSLYMFTIASTRNQAEAIAHNELLLN